MVCPKGNSLGFGIFPRDKLSEWDLFLAFLISETNYLISILASAVYRKMKNLSFWMNLAWNLVIFFIFVFAFLILIICVRIDLYVD